MNMNFIAVVTPPPDIYHGISPYGGSTCSTKSQLSQISSMSSPSLSYLSSYVGFLGGAKMRVGAQF